MVDIGYGNFIVLKKINNSLKNVLKELDILIKQYNKI